MIHDITLAAVAVRWLLFAALLLLAGWPWFVCWVEGQAPAQWQAPTAPAASAAPVGPDLPGLMTGLSLLALALSGAQLLQVVMRMADSELADLDADMLGWVLGSTTFGQAWLVRIVALVLILALAVARPRPRSPAVWCGLKLWSALALISLPWSGHAGAGQGWMGVLQLLADVLHLGAAAVWASALLGLLLLLGRAPIGLARTALHNFVRPGVRIVGVLVLTGLLRSHDLLGWTLSHWSQSDYALRLLLKLLLFGLMLGLAWHNRQYGLPRWLATGEHGAARRQVGWLMLLEALCLLGVLALVAMLGMTVPPAHAE